MPFRPMTPQEQEEARQRNATPPPAATPPGELPPEEDSSILGDIVKGAAVGVAKGVTEAGKTLRTLTPAPIRESVDALDRALHGQSGTDAVPVEQAADYWKNQTPKSLAGSFAAGMGQFLINFIPANKALKTAGVANALLRSFSAGALADFSAFDAQEERLSNLIEKVPALKNPVTAYLAADENDGEIEGKIKQVMEGVALGALTQTVIQGLRVLRGARAAKAVVEQGAKAPVEEAATTAAKPASTKPASTMIDLSTDIASARIKPKAVSNVSATDLLTNPGKNTRLAGTDIATPLRTIAEPGDATKVLHNMVKLSEPGVEAARRGKMTFGQIEEHPGEVAQDRGSVQCRRDGGHADAAAQRRIRTRGRRQEGGRR